MLSSLKLYRGYALILVTLFLSIAVIALANMAEQSKKESDEKPIGSVSVYTHWPEGNNDVDTWVLGPGDKKPVGYSRMHGMQFDFLKDDTGGVRGASLLNFENVAARDIIPGEYVVNLHCFRCSDSDLPIVVNVLVNYKGDVSGSAIPIFSGMVTLRRNREEITAVRFKMDSHKQFEYGSKNFIPYPLLKLVDKAEGGQK